MTFCQICGGNMFFESVENNFKCGECQVEYENCCDNCRVVCISCNLDKHICKTCAEKHHKDA